jgi:hypothetical protein
MQPSPTKSSKLSNFSKSILEKKKKAHCENSLIKSKLTMAAVEN